MRLTSLMSNSLYLGVRVEVAARFYTMRSIAAQYNRRHDSTRVMDVCKNGKITIEKRDGMLIAHGEINEKVETGLVNFAVVAEVGKKQKDLDRVVQIVNVLGNDRLIRERVKTFVDGHSILSKIPELAVLQEAFTDINKIMKGFTNAAWYYAPEAIIE